MKQIRNLINWFIDLFTTRYTIHISYDSEWGNADDRTFKKKDGGFTVGKDQIDSSLTRGKKLTEIGWTRNFGYAFESLQFKFEDTVVKITDMKKEDSMILEN